MFSQQNELMQIMFCTSWKPES